jgi:hypothetical protein
MSLVELKSVFDRQKINNLGDNVGVTTPSDGDYFTAQGTSDSPFDSSDHMVELMTNDVTSNNHSTPITYLPSPNSSPYQDLDGTDGGNGYFHNIPNPGKGQGKQIGGKDLHEHLLTSPYNYTHGDSLEAIGASPGETGNSEYQDLDGVKGPIFGDASGQGKQLGGKDLHEKLLTSPYNYTHGDSTENVGPSPGETGNSTFQDLDGVKGPIFGDASGQGKQLGGKDLHEHLLTDPYKYTYGGFSEKIGSSPGETGNSKYQDLDGVRGPKFGDQNGNE